MLDTKIAEARAAADELARQDAIRTKAAQLPALEAEQQRREDQERAEAVLQQVAKRAEIRLAGVQPKVAAWQERLTGVLLEVQELIDELPSLEGEILQTARELSGSVRAVGEAAQPASSPTDYFYQAQARAQGNATPDALRGASPTLLRLWRQAGGEDPSLDALGNGTMGLLDSQFGQMLRSELEKRCGMIYRPGRAEVFLARF
jgi:hypothetical protein